MLFLSFTFVCEPSGRARKPQAIASEVNRPLNSSSRPGINILAGHPLSCPGHVTIQVVRTGIVNRIQTGLPNERDQAVPHPGSIL